MTPKTRTLTALLAVLLLAAWAPTAHAGFRLNSSMEGVRLGDSRSEVTERLGKPRREVLGTDFVDWIYIRPPLTVTLKDEVVTLFTESRRIRGPRSIGVGTRERRLRAVVGRRLSCATAGGQRLCVTGSLATGRRSTMFELRRGRVSSVTIALSTP